MAEPNTRAVSPDTSVGHLSVHLENEHPVETRFLFEQPQKRLPGAFGFSAFTHAAFVVLVLLVIRYAPAPASSMAEIFNNRINKDIIWLAEPGPGGGGGGGGNRMPDPPRKLELPGKDKISVPVKKPEAIKIDPKPQDLPQVEQSLVIPAQTLMAGAQTLPGAIEGTTSGLSQGPGSGGGAGTGTGTGIGPGSGPGLGPGSGGGTGGGVYQPGSGVSLPVKLREVKPQYTADAMRAKVQGVVVLECVVMPDGTVGEVHVTRSLDAVFGLDQEAIKAAKQWRFVPGMKQGQPVPVLISIEMEFTLR
jgi:protein TonB